MSPALAALMTASSPEPSWVKYRSAKKRKGAPMEDSNGDDIAEEGDKGVAFSPSGRGSSDGGGDEDDGDDEDGVDDVADDEDVEDAEEAEEDVGSNELE